ncbi:TorF family putative porin [Sphingopyxis yananensis]|uniref:TorF family putative porin n=1 Tax=Sphingopyxis yananensis TaxID=2886687 RepID=UPI001D12EB7A|nr:TorF family putative porin [Sphingopyxis yananensis]MCC2602623.1 TorF family putative porin [Sphingopyxis yananensis]
MMAGKNISLPVAAKLLLAMAVGLSAAPSASAQTDAPGDISVTGGAVLVSDYRYRGLSQTGGDIAFQPQITVQHYSGIYAGAWASNIKDTAILGGLETQLYGGYAREIASGTTLDVGLTYYLYPDGKQAMGNSDYAELNSQIGYLIGPVEAKASLDYAWNQSALGSDNLYASFAVSAGIPNTPVTIKAQTGYTDGALARFGPKDHVWDWSLGASANIGPVTAGLSYVDTNVRTTGVKALDKYYDGQIILSLGLFF